MSAEENRKIRRIRAALADVIGGAYTMRIIEATGLGYAEIQKVRNIIEDVDASRAALLGALVTLTSVFGEGGRGFVQRDMTIRELARVYRLPVSRAREVHEIAAGNYAGTPEKPRLRWTDTPPTEAELAEDAELADADEEVTT